MGNIKYVLPKDIWIEIGEQEFLKIDNGFCWDGCTFVIDLCSAASCVHDWLHSAKKEGTYTVMKYGICSQVNVTRLQADRLYKKFLNKHYPLLSRTRFIGLRLIGWIFWKKNQPYFLDVNQMLDLKLKTCEHGIQVLIKPDSKVDGYWFESFTYYKI